MNTPTIKSITIIGTGRVAHHLCHVIATNGLIIAEVVGRNMLKAIDLAKLCGAKPVGKLEQVSQDADLYVIAVSDDAIEEVINSLPSLDGLVVHTSGMKSQQVFERNFARFGIFYPLQTFSFERKPDFSTIPVFVQSNSDEDTQLLWALGKMILSEVHVISDTQRQRLHLAAVFVNNFCNAMYSIADEILTLDTFPERFRIMDSEPEKRMELRRMLVDNYSVFYTIRDERVIVTDVLYTASDIEARLRGEL